MTGGDLTWSGRLAGRMASTVRDGPLAVTGFRLLSVGQLTSTVGDYCYAVALPWLVLSAHGGTLLLGTVLACYGVPRTVLIPLGGMLADKLRPRTVMLAADATRCVLLAALTALAARQVTSLVALAPVAALLGAGEGVFLPASFSIMPTLLPPRQLASGNAVSTAMVQVGSLAGPVLGGLLVATAGSAPAFAVDAASFAVSAIALGLIRLPSPAVTAPSPPRSPSPSRHQTSRSRTAPSPPGGPACGACSVSQRSCRSCSRSASWLTSPLAARSRSRCRRWRTLRMAPPVTARWWPASGSARWPGPSPPPG